MQKFCRSLGVRRGGEDCTLVIAKNFEPNRDIGSVILARFESDSEVGTQKRSAKFGDQLLGRVGFGAKALAQIACESARVSTPMRLMPLST